ncbi:Rhomboid protease GluP [archaeon HR03]|nr:Rhomboid protease GluP [archaeon HR03]
MYEEYSPHRPRLVYVIIVANIVVWLFINIVFTNQVALNRFLLSFGAVPFFILNGQNLLSLISYMFIHVDFLHIFLNMYALFLFGRDVEERLGSALFLVVYFLSGVVAAVFHMIYYAVFMSLECSPFVRPLPAVCVVPAIGASGAIFGIMGSYLVFFPRRPLAAFLYLIPIIAPAYIVIAFIILIQTFFMLTMPFSTIAYTAHVGGFIAGLLTSLPFRNRGPRWTIYG